MSSSDSNVLDLDWGDAQFHGFRWENDGKDLTLFVDHGSKPIARVVLSWASDLVVDLSWSRVDHVDHPQQLRRGGPLLSGAGSVESAGDGRWRLTLEFPGDGFLSVEFAEMTADSA